MKKIIISLAALLLVSYAHNANAETKFKPGQTYSGFLTLEGYSKDIQVALPEGVWEVAVAKIADPKQNFTGAALYLFNSVDSKLKGIMTVFYLWQSSVSGWNAPLKTCGSDRNLYAKNDILYDRTQTDCWRIAALPLAAKKPGNGRNANDYMRSKGLSVPVLVPEVRYYKIDYDRYLSVRYIKIPEFYGIPKVEEAGSTTTNDYAPSRIGEYPKKKKFVDDLNKWAQEWDKKVELGFRGKLTEKDMGPVVAKEAPPQTTSDDDSIESKLKKLKTLVDKGLITSEDAAIKRKEILSKF